MNLIGIIFEKFATVVGIIIGIVFAGYLIFDGLDAIDVNKNSTLKNYSMEDVEKSGVGSSRYVKVDGVFVLPEFVYQHYEDSDAISKVIFPVISRNHIEKILDRESIEVKVVVINDDPNPECKVSNPEKCVDYNLTSIQGVTMNFPNDLSEEEKKLLNSSDMKLAKDLVVIKLNATPTFASMLTLYLGIGGLILLIIGIYFELIRPLLASHKTVVKKVMASMVLADGEVSASEIGIFSVVLERIFDEQMSEKEIIKFIDSQKGKNNLDYIASKEKYFDYKTKRDIMTAIILIMIADGVLEDSEQEELMKIGSKLGFSDNEIEAIQRNVINNFMA